MPREDLPALLRGAEVLLFASTCEACPNILLEYLASGRPVLCSKAPPMPEFGGTAVRYVEAENPKAWCDEIARILEDPKGSLDLGVLARERAQLYSWDKTAEKTLAALTEW